MQLSPHFTLAEAIISQEAVRKGIDNTPGPDVLTRMVKTAQGMEAVRIRLGGAPITVSSWFRCLDLNRAVGSQDTSQHLLGEAVDFICPRFGNPTEVAVALRDSGIEYDQLILEFRRWVHISFGPRRRHEALTIDDAGTRPMFA